MNALMPRLLKEADGNPLVVVNSCSFKHASPNGWYACQVDGTAHIIPGFGADRTTNLVNVFSWKVVGGPFP